ncbi:MAG TPA: single-stranded DNA-binding protein [Salinimicrobium sp.]|nr:single-stranded DNA-binding protein [Salinimicrobium sp.]
MSRLQNRVQLIGHVGIDPEFFTFASGEKKATIKLATHRFSKDVKGEFMEETDWHTILVYGKLTEVVENFVRKGKQIGIDGKLTYRSYDAADGTKRYITEVLCDELILMGGGHGTLKPSMEESYAVNK